MKKELSSMQIFNDFVSKTILSENEVEVLKRYIKGETIIKIASETAQGTATVSRVIAELKEKYSKYKELELAKLILFQRSK